MTAVAFPMEDDPALSVMGQAVAEFDARLAAVTKAVIDIANSPRGVQRLRGKAAAEVLENASAIAMRLVLAGSTTKSEVARQRRLLHRKRSDTATADLRTRLVRAAGKTLTKRLPAHLVQFLNDPPPPRGRPPGPHAVVMKVVIGALETELGRPLAVSRSSSVGIARGPDVRTILAVLGALRIGVSAEAVASAIRFHR